MHGRVQLDLLKIHSIRTDSLGHCNTLTLDTGCICCDKAVQLGAYRCNHIIVRTKAAAGNNHRFRFYRYGRSVCIDSYYAAGSAVFPDQDFCRLGFEQKLDVFTAVKIRLQKGNNIRSDRKHLAVSIYRAVNTFHRCAAESRNIVKHNFRFQAAKPFNGVGTVFCKGFDQLGIVDPTTADHGVKTEKLCRIEVSFGIGLVSFPLFGNNCTESLDFLIVRVVGHFCQGSIDTGSLLKGVGILPLCLGSIHTACGTGGVSADQCLAFQHNNCCTGIRCRDCCRHACTTCSDDNDISLIDHVFRFRCFLSS